MPLSSALNDKIGQGGGITAVGLHSSRLLKTILRILLSNVAPYLKIFFLFFVKRGEGVMVVTRTTHVKA